MCVCVCRVSVCVCVKGGHVCECVSVKGTWECDVAYYFKDKKIRIVVNQSTCGL